MRAPVTRNLSSTEKSVCLLCPLLLQTDFLLEVGVRDDLLRSRRNLCIKHLEIRESTPSNRSLRLEIVQLQ